MMTASVAVSLVVQRVRLADLTELSSLRELLSHVLQSILADHVLVVAVIFGVLSRAVTTEHLPLAMLLL